MEDATAITRPFRRIADRAINDRSPSALAVPLAQDAVLGSAASKGCEPALAGGTPPHDTKQEVQSELCGRSSASVIEPSTAKARQGWLCH